MSERAPLWGLGFSPAAEALLQRLQHAALLDGILSSSAPETPPGMLLQQHWPQAGGFVVVGACGLVTRLIAPLLTGKASDPAVVVLDPQGRFAVPLLGGHSAGADALSQRIAAVLGGCAVLTGSSSGEGRLVFDSFGLNWGWRRGSGDWDALMKRSAREQNLAIAQQGGTPLWRQSLAGLGHGDPSSAASQEPALVIGRRWVRDAAGTRRSCGLGWAVNAAPALAC